MTTTLDGKIKARLAGRAATSASPTGVRSRNDNFRRYFG
jgi:hypothetical protein